jgi:hypothetical protein
LEFNEEIILKPTVLMGTITNCSHHMFDLDILEAASISSLRRNSLSSCQHSLQQTLLATIGSEVPWLFGEHQTSF